MGIVPQLRLEDLWVSGVIADGGKQAAGDVVDCEVGVWGGVCECDVEVVGSGRLGDVQLCVPRDTGESGLGVAAFEARKEDFLFVR